MFILFTFILMFSVLVVYIFFINIASAKQIIIIKDDDKIVINEKSLNEILLQPSVKDKRICVISIAGFSSEGKTFFLNFLIEHLKLKYKRKNWFSFENGTSEFPWKNKAGIMMWSEVFQAELPSGEEIAVVLLDTQTTTKKQFEAVFAITTLISSVLIISFKEKIHENDLEHLKYFSGFGEENEELQGSPFQNLYLLVTDWPNNTEFDHGLKGGQQLLERGQKNDFVALFENVQCCLLPHAGTIDNRKTEIDPKFLQHVEEFISVVLKPEKLKAKKINDNKITCSELSTYIESYTQYFSTGRVPPVKIMHMASAEAQLKIISKKAENLYKTSMDNIVGETLKTEILEEHHLEEKQKAVEYYNNNLIGNDQLQLQYKQFLKEKLDQRYLAYRKSNRIKQESHLNNKKFQKKTEKETDGKLHDLKQKLDDLERELLRNQEKFQSQIQILKQQQRRQEEIQKADQDRNDRRVKILEDRLNWLQNLLNKYPTSEKNTDD